MKRIFAILILASSILPSFSTPSYAADTIPPKLVDWMLQRPSVDISKSSTTLSVKFVISDENRVNQPKLLVQSLTTSQKSGYALVQELGKSGNLTSYEATVTIDFGSANGEWEWVLLPLSDSVGNINNSNGPEINWVKKFIVFDSSYTSQTYECILRVQRFNKYMKLIKDFQKDYPERVSLVILKYSIPKNFFFDEKLCLSDPNLGGLYLNVDGLVFALDSLLAFADSDKAAAEKAAAEKAAAKEKAVICLKGKSSLKVIGKNPKCPVGYKVKK